MGVARRPKGARGTGGRPEKANFDAVKKKEIGVSDLTLLSKISNEAINDNLKKRFEGKEIYTYIGHVLVSVNPFRDLGIYTDEVLDSYKGKNRLDMPPHVYAIAESAYFNLKAYKHNQCVIISGESGAGKTEAAKRIMQYIANVSVHKDDRTTENARATKIKDMVLATNPLLESFGNAKTLRNNNSSRFGKYLQIHFDKGTDAPVGADITNYLLEKSRVVGQIVNERNFHIFYQFTKGASQKYRDTFGIQGPETYAYLARSKCFDVDGINDISDFKDTLEAMNIIGLTQEEQDEIFRMLAAILWVGNIQFTEDDSGYAAVMEKSVVDYAAYLLEVTPAQLLNAITIRILTPRSGEVIESPTNPAQATATRDALAKAIYSNLFDWIVGRINNSLNSKQATKTIMSIGILDIYGFEIFEKNSFEQLCINYVNEKLQQIFIQLTLKAEQEEYAREQIQWTPIKFFDNKVVCDLIEQIRPPGIFSAMKDATKTAHADPAACDRTFMQSINGMSHGHLTPRQGNFIIKHYAGDVAYQVDGITDKNKDQLLKGLLNLFQGSKRPFVHTLFPQQVDQDNRRQPPSAGDRIRESANLLVDTLMKCSPSYIRTIKPNENKSPTEYNGPNVLHQIKYLGLQENVRIRRAGFAARQEFETFRRRFFHLSSKLSYAAFYTYDGTDKDATRIILEDTKIPPEEWQMGVTKVFIKSPETLFALETMREKWLENLVIRVQRWWRKYLAPMQLMKIRDKGHKLLGGRKERRSMSLLGSRRFLGDYLGIDATTGPGAKIRSAANIGSSERTVFSCQGEILETKFGRSSKTSPRTIVVTNRNFYIVAQMLVNGQHQIATEKSIPLGAIKFIGTSSCQDDWFSLGIGSPQEGDPLMNCIFKTEMFTQMQEVMPSGLNLKIGDSIEYAKKPNKMQMVKVLKDSQMREDYYKSGAIHTKQGNPANSESKPTPRSKSGSSQPSARSQRLVRQIPDTSASTATHVASNAASHAQNTTNAYTSPKASTNVASNAASHAQNAANAYSSPKIATHVATNAASHARNTSGATRRPPPPPTPPTPSKIWAKATWAYPQPGTEAGAGCLTIAADEEIEILDKSEQGGWWKAMNKAGEMGFVPESYVKELPPPPPKSKAPVVPNKKVDIRQKRDSGMGLNGTNGSDSSRSNTPTPTAPADKLYQALMANQRAK